MKKSLGDMLTIYVDGACSGNPGPAAIGVVIDKDGERIEEISRAIGHATNNVAEYSALICGLQEALVRKAKGVKVITDSELMFHQLSGNYKVKDEKIKLLFEQVQQLRRGFKDFELTHVPREKNKVADKLATEALKRL